MLNPSLCSQNPRTNLFPVRGAAVDTPFNGHAFTVGEVGQIEPVITLHETELSAERRVRCAAVKPRSVLLAWRKAVRIGDAARSHKPVHYRVKPPPEMLKVADDLWPVLSFG